MQVVISVPISVIELTEIFKLKLVIITVHCVSFTTAFKIKSNDLRNFCNKNQKGKIGEKFKQKFWNFSILSWTWLPCCCVHCATYASITQIVIILWHSKIVGMSKWATNQNLLFVWCEIGEVQKMFAFTIPRILGPTHRLLVQLLQFVPRWSRKAGIKFSQQIFSIYIEFEVIVISLLFQLNLRHSSQARTKILYQSTTPKPESKDMNKITCIKSCTLRARSTSA